MVCIIVLCSQEQEITNKIPEIFDIFQGQSQNPGLPYRMCGNPDTQGHNRIIGKTKNGNSVFSIENNSMLTSFGKKLVTLKVTTNMSKLLDKCLSLTEKNEFPFFDFPIFRHSHTQVMRDAQSATHCAMPDC